MKRARTNSVTLTPEEQARAFDDVAHHMQDMSLNPNGGAPGLDEDGGFGITDDEYSGDEDSDSGAQTGDKVKVKDPEVPKTGESFAEVPPVITWPNLRPVNLTEDRALQEYASHKPNNEYLQVGSQVPSARERADSVGDAMMIDPPSSPLPELSDSDDEERTLHLTHILMCTPMNLIDVTIRRFENKYATAGETPGYWPKHTRHDFRHKQDTDFEKFAPYSVEGIRYLLQIIISQWPSSAGNTAEEIEDAVNKLITSYVFYRELFRPVLRDMVNWQANRVEKDKRFNLNFLSRLSRGEAKEQGKIQGYEMDLLWKKLESDGPDADRLKEQLRQTFLQVVEGKIALSAKYKMVTGVPETLHKAAAIAREEANQIDNWRKLGQYLYENSLMVPAKRVEKKEAKGLQGKFIVEAEDIRDIGIEKGAFDEKEIVFPQDPSWTRIVKPAVKDKVVSIILYDRDLEVNGEIPDEAILGAVVYNAEHFTSNASEINQEKVHLEAQGLMAFGQFRDKVKHKFKYPRSMFKTGFGSHSTNFIKHVPKIIVGKKVPKSAKGKAKLAHQANLRVRVAKNKDLIQCHNFALLEGFCPHLAAQQLKVAREAGLINRFGCPDAAAFASFAYSAPAHIDNDDTVTMGWISSRSHYIKDDECNFFYSDYKLILELAENVHWIWNAAADYHGTTLGRLCARDPKKWKTFAKNSPLEGQWSRTNVITRTLVQSSVNVTF